MLMDIDEIKRYLPHRYPFLFVDRVTELESGKRIVGYKNVSINEPYFQGHFPQYQVFPGVLLTEAMAQVAGILGFEMAGKTPEDGSIYMLVGVDNVRFKRPVVPGDQVKLEAEYLSQKRNVWKFACKASVEGEKAASATVICVDKDIS